METRIRPYASDPQIRFYSILFGKIYTIHCPKSLNKMLFEQSDGYTIARRFLDPGQVSLLNLLSNHEIPLPVYDFCGCTNWIQPWKNQMGVHAVCYGSKDCKHPILVSCHPGQENWCVLNLQSGLDYGNCNLFYLNGMVFSVERRTGVTKVKDIITGTLTYVIAPIEGSLENRISNYIVDASNYILRVIRHDGWFSFSNFNDVRFDVYRLNINKSDSGCWVKVVNIGNKALFIDQKDCIVLRANDFAGIKKNCIYYLMRVDQTPLYGVERIDIETGAREHFPCPFWADEQWFVPRLHRLLAE